MTRVVVDASVAAALAFGEQGADRWSRRLEGASLHAPRLLHYELQSVARKKCRADPAHASAIIAALVRVLDPSTGITWHDVDPADVVLVANATGLTTYDASYVCLAGVLGAELATADRALIGALSPHV